MLPFARLTVIGLGLIGSSVARAVKAHMPSVRITGHDADPLVVDAGDVLAPQIRHVPGAPHPDQDGEPDRADERGGDRNPLGRRHLAVESDVFVPRAPGTAIQ